MIRKVRLEDAKGRDGPVWLSSPSRTAKQEFHSLDGGAVRFERIIKSPMDRCETTLRRLHSDDDSLARALIDSDPEIDMEAAGRIAYPCDRVWVDPEGTPLYAAQMVEVIYGPDGSEKERRPPQDIEATVGEDMPLRWTGRFFRREEIVRRFAITRKFQILHTDGLTFDFLHRMAAMLEKKDALASIGAGPKGRDPLVFERNGTPHRAFLEGRTRGDEYMLILYLSSLELKRPPL
jgi:PAS domain-containing protein